MVEDPEIVRLTTAGEVEALLGRELSESETRRAESLILAASVLVAQFTGADYQGGVPQVHQVVAATMVARAMATPQEMVGVNQATDSTGPFTHTRSYTSSFSEGGVWLSSMDKQMLGGGRRAEGVRMVSERYA